jgi:D-glycero-beta-D-manno-heptose-7-phosphate kinase
VSAPRSAAEQDTRNLVRALAGCTVAVVGDVFLDEYLVGHAERLSREGPVPVLGFDRRFCLPGGAANPARNVAGLGAVARQVGVVGTDAAAGELQHLLALAKIDSAGVVIDPSRPTTVKTRIVAEGGAPPQQVARIDRQSRLPVSGTVEAALVSAVTAAAEGADAVLVSDYKSGVVTEAVRDAARDAAEDHGIWLTVDSQGDLDRFAGFHLVRAALRDAETSLGRRLDSEPAVEKAARGLVRDLGARAVVLSRGAAGMSVAGPDFYSVVPPANVSEVFDVAGAGDTVIAVLTLALAAGAPLMAAIQLANAAAGIVVRRLGVVAPTPAELLAA